MLVGFIWNGQPLGDRDNYVAPDLGHFGRCQCQSIVGIGSIEAPRHAADLVRACSVS